MRGSSEIDYNNGTNYGTLAGGGNLGLRTTHIKHLVMPDYIIFFEIFEIEEVKTGTSKQVF